MKKLIDFYKDPDLLTFLVPTGILAYGYFNKMELNWQLLGLAGASYISSLALWYSLTKVHNIRSPRALEVLERLASIYF